MTKSAPGTACPGAAVDDTSAAIAANSALEMGRGMVGIVAEDAATLAARRRIRQSYADKGSVRTAALRCRHEERSRPSYCHPEERNDEGSASMNVRANRHHTKQIPRCARDDMRTSRPAG